MIDVKNVAMKLIHIRPNNCNPVEFCEYINTPAVCVSFSIFTQSMLNEFLADAGFHPILKAHEHYIKIVNSLIMVIHVECNVDNFVLKQKYFMNNTEENLNYILTVGIDEEESFRSFHSDADVCGYNLYPESLDIPFQENYLVISAYATPNLRRVDMGFKYGNDKFMFASVFDKIDNRIQIAYDTYTANCNYVYSDFIQFVEGKLTDVKMYNPKNHNRMSMINYLDDFYSHDITLDNYHLFWEQYSPEQVTLIEMLMV